MSCYQVKHIVIPNSVTSIAALVMMSDSSLQTITIPSTVTSLQNMLFQGCESLMSINLPNTITSIGSSVFSGCKSLVSIQIPKNVSTINASTFSDCNSMKYISFENHTTIPTLANTNAFTNIPNDCKIIVPDDLYTSWIATTNWSTYASHIIKVSDV